MVAFLYNQAIFGCSPSRVSFGTVNMVAFLYNKPSLESIPIFLDCLHNLPDLLLWGSYRVAAQESPS
jgi:hypothetical protein